MRHEIETMRFCVTSYLSDIRNMEAAMKDLEQRIAGLRYRIDGLSSRSPSLLNISAGIYDRIGDGIAQLEELEELWTDKVGDYASSIATAVEICSPVHLSRYAVWLHVAEKRTWTEVGKKIGYSNRQTRTIADEGVKEIYELMPETYRCDSIPNAIPD